MICHISTRLGIAYWWLLFRTSGSILVVQFVINLFTEPYCIFTFNIFRHWVRVSLLYLHVVLFFTISYSSSTIQHYIELSLNKKKRFEALMIWFLLTSVIAFIVILYNVICWLRRTTGIGISITFKKYPFRLNSEEGYQNWMKFHQKRRSSPTSEIILYTVLFHFQTFP